MSKHLSFGYFWYRRPVKARTRLRICAVSSEPSLLAHTKYRSRWRLRSKSRTVAPLGSCTHVFKIDNCIKVTCDGPIRPTILTFRWPQLCNNLFVFSLFELMRNVNSIMFQQFWTSSRINFEFGSKRFNIISQIRYPFSQQLLTVFIFPYLHVCWL